MFVPLRDVNPTRTFPFISYLLLASNVVVFVLMVLKLSQGQEAFVNELGLVPARISHEPIQAVYTVFTSMFMHGGVAHLGSNMLFMHVFADNIEDALGHARFLAFYLLCGVAAALAQVAIDPSSTIPMVGASGAIAGVVGAYLALYPRAPIVTFNSIFPLWFVIGLFPVVPAWLVAGEFFIANLLQGIGSLGLQIQGGIAFFAHLGGFVCGLVLGRLWTRRRAEVSPWHGFRRTRYDRSRRSRRW
jgi:membrane associated rhomboid family serine protease